MFKFRFPAKVSKFLNYLPLLFDIIYFSKVKTKWMINVEAFS